MDSIRKVIYPGSMSLGMNGDEKAMSETIRICPANEVPIEGAKLISCRGRQIALINHQDQFYAIENRCPHKAGPLGLGAIKNGMITCPWHRFRFDLQTGRSVTNPAMIAKMYPVEIEGDQLWLEIEVPGDPESVR